MLCWVQISRWFVLMVLLHFRMKLDANLSMEEFHRKNGASFLKVLLEEIHAVFDMSCIDPIEALYMLDPVDIPKENLPEHGNEKLEILLDFYGKTLQDSYEGRTGVSLALINCTQESLSLEFKHYKKDVISRRNDLSVESLAKEKSIKRKLDWSKCRCNKKKKRISKLLKRKYWGYKVNKRNLSPRKNF